MTHVAHRLTDIGRAIDRAMLDGRYDEAAALCREILRISPASVRPRCTLAWICIGRGRLDQVQSEVTAYMNAAALSGDLPRAAGQLRLMADATVASDLRRFIAEQLARAGYAADAQRIMRDLLGEVGRETPLSDEEQRRIWQQVLDAALRDELHDT